MTSKDHIQMSSTMTEVARRAGVSITTVSQVYSGKRPVSDATRQRVLESAWALGYQPHQGKPTVGLLVRPDEALTAFQFGTTSFAEITGSVTLACLNRGFKVFTCQEVDELAQHGPRVDGCIVLHPNFRDEALEELERRGTPTVAFDPDPGSRTFRWWAGFDYPKSFASLVEHLFDAGTRRLAALVGQTDNNYRRSLLWAYTSTVTRRGVRPLLRMIDNRKGQVAAEEACKELLLQSDGPDAVVTSSSVFALGALNAATELGLTVPKDFMVATVLDGPLAEYATPPITGLRMDTTATAAQIVKLLEMRISGDRLPSDPQAFPLNLQVRESSSR